MQQTSERDPDLGARAAANLDALASHRPLPETRLSRRIDSFLHRLGNAASWLWILLLAIVVSNVVLRYAFGHGRIEFEEIQWHLYAVGLLLGISYCVVSDDHIRVDVLHGRLSSRMQAWIELYGILLLLLPFATLVLLFSLPFVASSFASGEVSAAPGGLPFRWLIKSAIPMGFALLLLAAIGRLARASSLLFGVPAPIEANPDEEPGDR